MAAKQDELDILKKQIAGGQIGRLYLFHGVETHLRDHYLSLIQKKLLPDGLDSFNLELLEGKGLALPALENAVQGVPVMSERKVVRVTDCDLYKLPAGDRPAWESFLSDLPEHVCLIFVYDIVPYKPDGRTKLHAVLAKSGLTVEFPLQDTAQLVTWLTRHFSAQGKVIDRGTCEYLLFRCGGLMTALRGEVGKVAAYARTERVTQKDIDAVVVPVLEAAVFDLTDAVAGGHMKKAAELLQTLQWMREPPEVLLGALSKTLRGLYAARLALDRRGSARQVMELLGYRSAYPAEKLMAAARKRSPEWCRRALLLCREADGALKGGSRDRERVLEWMLAGLA